VNFLFPLFLTLTLWGEGLKTGDTVFLFIKSDTLKVEVVADSISRRKGLQDRFKLAPNEGMLFCFERSQFLSFWMKETFIPLSIAFIDSEGVIVGIDRMEPLTTTPHFSPSPAKFALETSLGWFEKRGIKPGDSLIFLKNLTSSVSPIPKSEK